jgi:hypothetical protein
MRGCWAVWLEPLGQAHFLVQPEGRLAVRLLHGTLPPCLSSCYYLCNGVSAKSNSLDRSSRASFTDLGNPSRSKEAPHLTTLSSVSRCEGSFHFIPLSSARS